MVVSPFRAWRAVPDHAEQVASCPADVLDAAEARRAAEGNPRSFLHVTKGEIDLDPSPAPAEALVHARSAASFRRMIEERLLVREAVPAYHVYRLVTGEHAQAGIVGAVAVRDVLEGRIRPHEGTRPDKTGERARHVDALSAHDEPVLLAYGAVPVLSAEVSGVLARDPSVDFAAADGVRHSLWVVDDPAVCSRIRATFAKIRSAYVADGHHLVAAAVAVAEKRRRGLPEPTGEEPHEFFLGALFPAGQLRVLEQNRLVRDLNGLDAASFLDRVRAAGFEVGKPVRGRRPRRKGAYAMFVGGTWYRLVARPGADGPRDPARSLDVTVLTERLLRPILGVGDPRTDRRLEVAGAGRELDELEASVTSGEHAVAFVLHPPASEEIMKVADAAVLLPPKSTWFEPKLRSGLVVLDFQER